MSMGNTSNLNVVHESEAQRQYARIKLPAIVKITEGENTIKIYPLSDISAGGFSITAASADFKVGQRYHGEIVFSIDGFKFTLDVEFQTSYVSGSDNRVGFELHDLNQQKISALRYMITSFLSGELVSTPDMINTLSRENYTKNRKSSKGDSKESPLKAAMAGVVTLGVLCVGLLAAIFVSTQLYGMLFVVKSQTAVIEMPNYEVVMPKTGGFEPLVAVGDAIATGQPLGVVSLPVLEYLGGANLEQTFDAESLGELVAKNLSGTLSSPCDCYVEAISQNSDFVAKDTSVVTLFPKDIDMRVDSVFSAEDARYLEPGDKVDVNVIGVDISFTGTVDKIQVVGEDGKYRPDVVNVSIIPEQKVDSDYFGWPLNVSKQTLPLAGLGI